MLNRIFFLFFYTLISWNVYSQNDKVLSINYEVKFNHPMIINSVVSKFDLFVDDKTYKYEFKEQINSNSTYQISDDNYYKNYYSYHIGKIDSYLDYHLTNDGEADNTYGYNVVDSLPKLKWHITKEKSTIGKYTCSKATTNYRGRNIIAYFTTSIPCNIGPNNLNGLPGAILYAKSHDDVFIFEAKKIEYTERPDSFIKFDSFDFADTISLKSFLEIKDAKMGKKLREMKAKFMNRIREVDSEAAASTAKVSRVITTLELFYEWQLVDEEKK
ncbi:GLPGLI family protein [Nonlabens sp.]|uniref:GLPGLI family protein n=1 Tax=Nonlabens sp. TaxID=1888209 RepID=UPI001BCB473D|nr:GLPGLI family protein [Nonlabens sp.]